MKLNWRENIEAISVHKCIHFVWMRCWRQKVLNNPVASLNQFNGGKKKFLLVTISHSLELTKATDSANIQIWNSSVFSFLLEIPLIGGKSKLNGSN